jgi:acetyl-CoA carboxylase biotin carboxyl carrier protein
MAGMDLKDLQNLIRLISRSDLAEFKMKDGDFELSIRTQHFNKGKQTETFVQSVPVSSAPSAPAVPVNVTDNSEGKPSQQEDPNPDVSPKSEEGSAESKLIPIKAPIVGTFYRSSSPEKPPYVKVGDTVKVGDVVCIVEAMKLFNEIESEVSGKVVQVLVDDVSPVEYDQVLFMLDPKG